MNNPDLVNAVMVLPEVKRMTLPVEQGGLGVTIDDLEDKLGLMIPSAVDEVAGAYEWDFAISETSTTSVADTAMYTLTGADNDCLNISSIRYGSDQSLLQKKTMVAMDKLLERRTISSILYWMPNGVSDGAPVVKLFATPSTSGETILYRYWRKRVDLSEFPPVCDYVLQMALAKRIISAYNAIYEVALTSAIGMYERGAGDTDRTELDPEVLAGNHRRYLMNGW